MWENFGGYKSWRIITPEANGLENFGEPPLTFHYTYGYLANWAPLFKFATPNFPIH